MSAEADIQVIDFLEEHYAQLQELAKASGLPDGLPAMRSLSDFEKAQVRIVEERLDKLLKGQGFEAFDEDEEDEIPQEPFIITSTPSGLLAAKSLITNRDDIVLLYETDWRTWVQSSFGGKKPILRRFRRYFMYFTDVLGELDPKEQISGMRLKGMQYVQLHEGEQLTLQAQKIKETDWSWDGKSLVLADEDEDEE